MTTTRRACLMILTTVAALTISLSAAPIASAQTQTAPPSGTGSHSFDPVVHGALRPAATHAAGAGSPAAPIVAPTPPPVNAPLIAGRSAISLVTSSSFTGHITSTGGTPLVGIDMRAYEFDTNSGAYLQLHSTTTGALGAYTFSNLPTDSYVIEAHDPAQHYATMNYFDESPYFVPDFVDATGGTIGPLDFSMPVAAHIKGTIHGPASADFSVGEVTAEVQVQDFSSGSPLWYDTGDLWTVSANGTYDVGDLPPDVYRLKVSDGGATIYAPVQSSTVTVAEGQTAQPIDVTLLPTAAGGLNPLAPSRLLDTRIGVGVAAGAVAPGGVVALQVDGQGGVPTTNVSAVVLNVTVAGSSGGGYVTAYADGATRPTASNLNFSPGQVVPNLVVVPVATNGKVDLYNGSAGSTQLVADVAGYYVSGTPTAPGAFGSLPPARLLDTRSGVGAAGAVAPNGVVSLLVANQGGVPLSNVSAVILNVTVAGSTAGGFVTAYGDGTTRPTASNLNFVAGQVVPNLVVAPVGANGRVDLYNGSSGTTQLVADVAGYYLSGTPIVAAGAFGSLLPARLLDTRTGVGAAAGAVAPGGVVVLQVTNHGAVPSSKVTAVVLNLTVAGSTGGGYVTAYGDGTARPTASNLNFSAGQVVPNLVVVPVGEDGAVDLYNGSSGSTQLVADVAGYYVSGP